MGARATATRFPPPNLLAWPEAACPPPALLLRVKRGPRSRRGEASLLDPRSAQTLVWPSACSASGILAIASAF